MKMETSKSSIHNKGSRAVVLLLSHTLARRTHMDRNAREEYGPDDPIRWIRDLKIKNKSNNNKSTQVSVVGQRDRVAGDGDHPRPASFHA